MLRRSFLQGLVSVSTAGLLARSTLLSQSAITVTPLADKLHLLAGAGGNIVVLDGPDGLLMIDSGLPEATAGILAETGKIGNGKVTRLIDTHWHYDHTGGNTQLARNGAKILAHDNTLARLSSPQTIAFFNKTYAALPAEGLPKETFKDRGRLTHGGEKLGYHHLPPAHTDGDTVILFENANVFHAGDLLFTGLYPFIDYSSNGSLAGMAANAEHIVKAVDGSTKIVPGHGPLAQKKDVKDFAEMLADCHEIMLRQIKDGKTLAQLQAAQPFKKYDEKWGQGFVKPEPWIAMNYAGMTARQSIKA